MRKRKLILSLFMVLSFFIMISASYGGDDKGIQSTDKENLSALVQELGDTGKPGVLVGHSGFSQPGSGVVEVTQDESELSDEAFEKMIQELGDTGKPGVLVGHSGFSQPGSGVVEVTQDESELSNEAFEAMIRELGDTGKPGKVIPHL